MVWEWLKKKRRENLNHSNLVHTITLFIIRNDGILCKLKVISKTSASNMGLYAEWYLWL